MRCGCCRDLLPEGGASITCAPATPLTAGPHLGDERSRRRRGGEGNGPATSVGNAGWGGGRARGAGGGPERKAERPEPEPEFRAAVVSIKAIEANLPCDSSVNR